jgi:hypothetical protein
MLRIAALFLLFSVALHTAAQTPADSGSVNVIEDPRVMLLMGKWKEVQERRDGKLDGWRVKIHFGTDRDKAKSVKTSFLNKHPEVTAYENYAQPLFVILVGDFRTRMEAYKFFLEIKEEYPAAFIVQDEIEMPRVNITKPEPAPQNGNGTGK